MERNVNGKRSASGLLPILFALLYGVSPIDIIPDVLPLIGVLDDALIVPLLLLLGFAQMRKSRRATVPTAQGPIIHPPKR